MRLFALHLRALPLSSRGAPLTLIVLLLLTGSVPSPLAADSNIPRTDSITSGKGLRLDDLPKVAPEKDENSVTFTVLRDRKKRFALYYESSLEKKEPIESVMMETREALGRVEVRLGKFEKEFKVVVLKKVNDVEVPFVTTGTFDKSPCIYATYNGTTTEVLSHGLGMLRIHEVSPKGETWVRVGGARALTSEDGFDGAMFERLKKSDGPASYKDAKSWASDDSADEDDRTQALATGWMMTYYLLELAPKKLTLREIVVLPPEKYPDVKEAWEAVQKKAKKVKKN